MTKLTETDLAALRAAVAEARENPISNHHHDEEEITGLYAGRRVYNTGETEWFVEFGGRGDWLTCIDETAAPLDMTDDEITAKISFCWDSDWDDVQDERPAGDFTLGSSDFSTRGQ